MRTCALVNAELREQAITAIAHHTAGRQRTPTGTVARLVGAPGLFAPSRIHALSRLSP
jgi:hypothetical protein